jgi:hypothetical protein
MHVNMISSLISDINKQVLKEHSKAFPIMIKLAEKKLKEVSKKCILF